jgi:hypothetical protein
MTIETSIDALTQQTTELLDVCVNLKSSTAVLIAEAVVVSENAALIPLITVATNLIDTQAMLVMYIGRGL